MVQKTRLATLLGLGGALLMSGAAYAQPPGGYPGGPPAGVPMGPPSGAMQGGMPSGMQGGMPGGAAGAGTVSNAPGAMSTTEMASTDMSSESIGSEVEGSSTLARTGGEPWMMALAGATLAIGALSLRRRIN